MLIHPLILSAQLVLSGAIGQTHPFGPAEPIPWTECAWCVADGRGDVHLPDGWRVRKGTSSPARAFSDVPGRVFSDGSGDVFYFDVTHQAFGSVRVADDGLHKGAVLAKTPTWNLVFHAAPAAQKKGFAARGRFFALDRKGRRVLGWTAGGQPLDAVFSFGPRKNVFVSLALHPESGDLLLGTDWPECRVHRFRVDGTEVENAFWPYPAYALALRNVGTTTWSLGLTVARIVESWTDDGRRGFGEYVARVNDIACTDEGFFIANTQGCQFYHAADTRYCARRFGGLAGVTALACSDGRVLAFAGYRMYNFWLDDRPGDVVSSDHTWRIAKRYDEEVSGVEVKDGAFYIHEARHGRVIRFDPRITEWVMRDKRQYDVTNVVVKATGHRARLGAGHAAVIEARGIVLRRQDGSGEGVVEQIIPEKATCLAADGDWLLAYVPSRKAILRYRFRAKEEK